MTTETQRQILENLRRLDWKLARLKLFQDQITAELNGVNRTLVDTIALIEQRKEDKD